MLAPTLTTTDRLPFGLFSQLKLLKMNKSGIILQFCLLLGQNIKTFLITFLCRLHLVFYESIFRPQKLSKILTFFFIKHPLFLIRWAPQLSTDNNRAKSLNLISCNYFHKIIFSNILCQNHKDLASRVYVCEEAFTHLLVKYLLGPPKCVRYLKRTGLVQSASVFKGGLGFSALGTYVNDNPSICHLTVMSHKRGKELLWAPPYPKGTNGQESKIAQNFPFLQS
ncbi:hypothetical protein EGR_05707 [Echinococcus granulosus]|uniref:Uncharacterized protein n=1 Tax=Echinococcus granulosus TaxID=6210 RepID=W6UF20_ECHGR|nr:hypothetical protein EGR_05707 [Echinococcus granulosus]EUB59456.1 hypothetical protein EGR_05707 [Echinococcus granulosus]